LERCVGLIVPSVDYPQRSSQLFSTIPGLRNMVNTPASSEGEVYDPRKRDPQFAHASSSPLWELVRSLVIFTLIYFQPLCPRPLYCTTIIPQSPCTPASSSPHSPSQQAPTFHSTPFRISLTDSFTRIRSNLSRTRMAQERGKRRVQVRCNLLRVDWMGWGSS
jgi:hypothetical protein